MKSHAFAATSGFFLFSWKFLLSNIYFSCLYLISVNSRDTLGLHQLVLATSFVNLLKVDVKLPIFLR